MAQAPAPVCEPALRMDIDLTLDPSTDVAAAQQALADAVNNLLNGACPLLSSDFQLATTVQASGSIVNSDSTGVPTCNEWEGQLAALLASAVPPLLLLVSQNCVRVDPLRSLVAANEWQPPPPPPSGDDGGGLPLWAILLIAVLGFILLLCCLWLIILLARRRSRRREKSDIAQAEADIAALSDVANDNSHNHDRSQADNALFQHNHHAGASVFPGETSRAVFPGEASPTDAGASGSGPLSLPLPMRSHTSPPSPANRAHSKPERLQLAGINGTSASFPPAARRSRLSPKYELPSWETAPIESPQHDHHHHQSPGDGRRVTQPTGTAADRDSEWTAAWKSMRTHSDAASDLSPHAELRQYGGDRPSSTARASSVVVMPGMSESQSTLHLLHKEAALAVAGVDADDESTVPSPRASRSPSHADLEPRRPSVSHKLNSGMGNEMRVAAIYSDAIIAPVDEVNLAAASQVPPADSAATHHPRCPHSPAGS
ncbi:hypothetical protein FOA52_004253 [Chlamydomonas sp. UWO 241]|nr:hypothetical protein FOA52_004253 [Chlamydomonas sp. UWO 241]